MHRCTRQPFKITKLERSGWLDLSDIVSKSNQEKQFIA